MTDHIIVKYSICAHTWGDRSCTIFKKNIDIYVAKGGNLCGFIFSLIDDYCEKKRKLVTSEKTHLYGILFNGYINKLNPRHKLTCD